MASGSEDGGFQIWDLGGSMILSETPHRSTVTAINFSPDDRYFITGSRDTYLKVWDAMLNFALVKTINTSIEILASCFSPNGLDLVIAGCGSSVAMLETSTWRMTGASTGYASLNLCVAYAPDGSYFLTGGDDSSITVWKRMGDGQIMARSRLTAHRAWIWCIKFGRDGKHFFSCSSDRSLKLWNAETQTVIATVGGHNHRVTCVTLLPGMTSTFVTSSLDGSLKVWNYDIVLKGDLRPVQLHYRLTGVSPDGKYLATTQGWNKQCNLYLTAEDDRFIANTAPHGGIVNAMAFSGDSTRLATLDVGHLGAHEAGSVTKAIVAITNLADCTVACSRLNVVGPRVITYCGSERIAVGTHVGEIIMFDARTFECLTSWHWQAEGSTTSATSLQSLAYSTSCRHLAGCVWGEGEDISPLIKVWESGSSNLALELTLPEEDSINNLAYSPDGSLLAASFIQGLILIWSAKGADYTLTKTIRPPWAMNRPSIHFSHQGRYLATGSADMNTRVWDVRKNFEMVCAYYGPVNVLDFKAVNELYFGMASGEKKLVKFVEK
ncbi:uncharacterized WD repeat-containing protein all2124-like [Lineus longissimus]|uniref:uncharacterized WD repeat-containing protein all2124-like n=1 Tax=Lineus longissimus TaxID=88925 RepID=UPI002B4F08E2